MVSNGIVETMGRQCRQGQEKRNCDKQWKEFDNDFFKWLAVHHINYDDMSWIKVTGGVAIPNTELDKY